MAVHEKQNLISNASVPGLLSNPGRPESLVRPYNDTYNADCSIARTWIFAA
jgi:hypothetical protein